MGEGIYISGAADGFWGLVLGLGFRVWDLGFGI